MPVDRHPRARHLNPRALRERRDATADQDDFFVEELNPQNPDEYRAGDRWTTVGVSPNIIDASFEALYESITYKLLKTEAAQKTTELVA